MRFIGLFAVGGDCEYIMLREMENGMQTFHGTWSIVGYDFYNLIHLRKTINLAGSLVLRQLQRHC